MGGNNFDYRHHRQHDQGEKVTAKEAIVVGDTPDAREGRRRLATADELGLSDADEQIPGKQWNFQQKFDAKMFARSVEWAPHVFNLPAGECDL